MAAVVPVRVQFRVDGGLAHFPGLNRVLTLDTAARPREEAARLAEFVHAARLFSLPERVGPTTPQRGSADYRSYVITVAELGDSHTVQADEPIRDGQLKALVDHLRAMQRRIASGGA
jgi:hypothetical protein